MLLNILLCRYRYAILERLYLRYHELVLVSDTLTLYGTKGSVQTVNHYMTLGIMNK